MLNPIVGMIHNQKADRWHPVIFREAPLPGPPEPDKPVRHKSAGHHTEGFETREAALESVPELAARLEEQSGQKPKLALEKDFPWDGEEIPAMVVYFACDGDTATPLF